VEVARYEELCKEGTEKDTTRVFQVLQEGGAIDTVTHLVVTRSTEEDGSNQFEMLCQLCGSAAVALQFTVTRSPQKLPQPAPLPPLPEDV